MGACHVPGEEGARTAARCKMANRRLNPTPRGGAIHAARRGLAANVIQATNDEPRIVFIPVVGASGVHRGGMLLRDVLVRRGGWARSNASPSGRGTWQDPIASGCCVHRGRSDHGGVRWRRLGLSRTAARSGGEGGDGLASLRSYRRIIPASRSFHAGGDAVVLRSRHRWQRAARQVMRLLWPWRAFRLGHPSSAGLHNTRLHLTAPRELFSGSPR
jgi:hypothetical protein